MKVSLALVAVLAMGVLLGWALGTDGTEAQDPRGKDPREGHGIPIQSEKAVTLDEDQRQEMAVAELAWAWIHLRNGDDGDLLVSAKVNGYNDPGQVLVRVDTRQFYNAWSAHQWEWVRYDRPPGLADVKTAHAEVERVYVNYPVEYVYYDRNFRESYGFACARHNTSTDELSKWACAPVD